MPLFYNVSGVGDKTTASGFLPRTPNFSGLGGVTVWCKGDTVLERDRRRLEVWGCSFFRLQRPLAGGLNARSTLHPARNVFGPSTAEYRSGSFRCALRARCEAPSPAPGSDHSGWLFQPAGSVASCPIHNAVTKQRKRPQTVNRPEGKNCLSGVCTSKRVIPVCASSVTAN